LGLTTGGMLPSVVEMLTEVVAECGGSARSSTVRVTVLVAKRLNTWTTEAVLPDGVPSP